MPNLGMNPKVLHVLLEVIQIGGAIGTGLTIASHIPLPQAVAIGAVGTAITAGIEALQVAIAPKATDTPST